MVFSNDARVRSAPRRRGSGCGHDGPDTFKVVFETDVALGDGQIVLNVTKSLAPIGAQRVWDLVNAKFFDEAAFFRVVPKFVVQFGIAGNPVVEQRWDNKVLPTRQTRLRRRT